MADHHGEVPDPAANASREGDLMRLHQIRTTLEKQGSFPINGTKVVLKIGTVLGDTVHTFADNVGLAEALSVFKRVHDGGIDGASPELRTLIKSFDGGDDNFFITLHHPKIRLVEPLSCRFSVNGRSGQPDEDCHYCQWKAGNPQLCAKADLATKQRLCSRLFSKPC
eukprot:m.36909 g.36909  ORF g.36909 m.36909 type:complete len:167 (+) comp7624_c0_seq1:346-846(+)